MLTHAPCDWTIKVLDHNILFMKELGRVRHETATDEEVIDAFLNYHGQKVSFRHWNQLMGWHMPSKSQNNLTSD